MPAWTILATAIASAVAAGAFAAAAIFLLRRRYSPELRHAGQAFTLWWALGAFEALTDVLRDLLALHDPVNVDAYVFLARLKIIAAGIAIWALGRYVLFLASGRRWVSIPIAVFAAAHAVFFLAGLRAGLPARIEVDTWAPRLILTGPGLTIPALAPLTLLFFFLPPIVLAIAYLTMTRFVHTRTQKVRVVAIGISILVFQVVGAIQFNPNTPANSALFAILPLLSAIVGLVVFATYHPPSWIARRFHIEGVANGNGSASRHVS